METNNIYIPGSQWLYYKIYTGTKLADTILIKYLFPQIQSFYNEQLINLFFFVRYNDPDFHIRLRFKTSNIGDVINAITPILNQLIKEQEISKVVIDSYIQECDRYERYNMDTVESIFSINSYTCMLLLKRLQLLGKECSNSRWLLSIKLIDKILAGLEYNYKQKFELISRFAENFRGEYLFTTHDYTKQINNRYRLYYSQIKMILNDAYNDVLIEKIINDCFDKQLPLFHNLKLNSNNVDRIIGGIIHMFMNRWFRSQNRLYEMMIYSFMEKYYRQQYFLS